MSEKQFRKMKKKELIDLVLEQANENDRLNDEIALLKRKLKDKQICIDNAGTIAEAAFEMNGVLAAAEAAAKQYLDNVKVLAERQEAELLVREKAIAAKCVAHEQATMERCNHMKEEAEKACAAMEAEAKERYNAILKKAEDDVETKWDELATRLEEFYQAHLGLKKLLTSDAAVQRNGQ